MGKVWDVVVVGAGPAGLCAGISAAQEGARALVLEKNKDPGGKLPFSGGGRGNLTHAGEIQELCRHYHGGDGPSAACRFLRPALYAFSNADLMNFFARRGLPLVVEPDGRVFPRTNRAKDALHVLLGEAEKLGVQIHAEARVVHLDKTPSGFSVREAGRRKSTVKGLCVVIATGGLAHPQLGAADDGYRLAERLGHSIVPCRPALVPVIVNASAFAPFRDCAGVTIKDTSVILERSGMVLWKKRGDVLFTHRGLSGPAVLDISREVEPGDVLRIVLVPGLKELVSAEKRILREISLKARRMIPNILHDLGLSRSLARALVKAQGIDPETLAANLTRESRRSLLESLVLGHPFPVESVAGWEEAMVTRGGVALSQVNPKTMESRVVQGLFFAGEVLDVDGESGGYNLQAAFSTGFLAGRSAALKALGLARC